MFLLLVLSGSLCDSLVVKSFLASTIAEKRRFQSAPYFSWVDLLQQDRVLLGMESFLGVEICLGRTCIQTPGSKGECIHRLWDKLSVLTLWADIQMFLKNHIKSTWFCLKTKTFLVLFSHIFFRQWQQFGK